MASSSEQAWSRRQVVALAPGLLLAGCAPAPQPTGPLELAFWHGANPDPNRLMLEKLVEQFNRSRTDIRVRPFYAGQADQQIPKILAAVIGGSPPDLLWYNATLTGQLVKNDALVPLDDFLAREPLLKQIYPNLLPTTRYRGRTWSVPFDTNNLAVFYNRRIFSEAGITTFPRTWSAFAALARQLTIPRQRYGTRLPLGKGEWTVFNWLPFLWAAGGTLLVQGQPHFDAPEAVRALAFWRSLIESGAASLSQPEQGYLFDDFFAGRVAMQVSGPWTLAELNASGIEYGAFALPADVRQATIVGGEQLFIFKTTPEREQAAWEFARYVLSTRFQQAWAMGTGYLPVTPAAARTSEYQQFLRANPVLSVFLAQLPAARPRPLDPTYPQLSDVLGRAVEQVLMEARSPEEALRLAQREAQIIVRTQPGDY